MSKQIAISVLGKDRPGIVAAITRVFYETGCNIEDSSMTLLRSEFAMLMLAALPAKLKQETLQEKLEKAAKPLGLCVTLRPLSSKEAAIEKICDEPCIISLYGADKPGIVYTISKLLADNNVNITDVQTSISVRAKKHVYIMFLEVCLPSKTAIVSLKRKLARMGIKLNVTVTLQATESQVL